MQTKIKSSDTFEKMSDDSNSLTLLMEIKGIAYKFESQKNIYLALDNAKCNFYAYRQGSDETNANYMSKFKNAIEVIEHYGGSIGDDAVLVTEELKKVGRSITTATGEEKKDAIKLAKSKAHAMAFLKHADKHRYTLLVTDLENQYTRGTDQYPTTITEAYNLLVNYKKPGGVGRDRQAKRSENRTNERSHPAPETLQLKQMNSLSYKTENHQLALSSATIAKKWGTTPAVAQTLPPPDSSSSCRLR
jgi:hypothetical protein